jgi:hypothetical protein
MKSECDSLFMKTTQGPQAEFVAVAHLAKRSFVEELKENTRRP